MLTTNKMPSSSVNEGSELCLHGCCPTQFFISPSSDTSLSKARSSSAACRQDFAARTSTSIFPNTKFSNHESLPSLNESFIEFIKVYPQFSETAEVDQIRAKEYYHLSFSNHTCLDYIGIGLFSYHQLQDYHGASSQIQVASSSHTPPSPPPLSSDIPFFSISYKTGSLKTQLLHGGHESEFEFAMKRRIMKFLNISENDYSMVFTANRTSAFKLLAESYPFQSNRKLLTVYDYESEAVNSMINKSEKRGARVMSAEFSWPRLRINSANLRKMMMDSKRKKRKRRGLFVFPLHSRVTGARYPYLWMNIAQENGWHILIDACALGPKDMDSFALSLIRPDFLICSFYKIFGDNPSGFGCLFVKKTSIPVLESSTSVGTVSLVPATKILRRSNESLGTSAEKERELKSTAGSARDDLADRSFSGRLQKKVEFRKLEGEPFHKQNKDISEESNGLDASPVVDSKNPNDTGEIECRCLDQVDSLGLILVTNRGRYLINWLVNSLMKLKHPNKEGSSLVKIYGPKVKFSRGPALAFNIFDWKGEKIEPVLVQKLADRSNISLSYGFLHHIWFSDKYQAEKAKVLQTKNARDHVTAANSKETTGHLGVTVITAAFGFLANFEDSYRLWAFVAQFLDADFVEKERWRYTGLNQKTIEI